MSRAETPSPAADDADAREDKQERRLYWRRVRRRTIGAAAVFAMIGMLWQLGDDSRPPVIAPAAPSVAPLPDLTPSPALQDVAAELESVENFAPIEIIDHADNADSADSAESAAFVESAKDAAAETFATETVTATEEPAKPPVAAESESAGAESESAGAEEISPPAAPPSTDDTASIADAGSDAPSVADDEMFFVETSDVTGFAVQVGAFFKKSAAWRIARKLRGEGFVMQILAHKPANQTMWRVRAGGYQTRAAAELARKDLVALGYPEAQVYDQR